MVDAHGFRSRHNRKMVFCCVEIVRTSAFDVDSGKLCTGACRCPLHQTRWISSWLRQSRITRVLPQVSPTSARTKSRRSVEFVVKAILAGWGLHCYLACPKLDSLNFVQSIIREARINRRGLRTFTRIPVYIETDYATRQLTYVDRNVVFGDGRGGE